MAGGRQDLRERRVIRNLAKRSVGESDDPWRVRQRFRNAKLGQGLAPCYLIARDVEIFVVDRQPHSVRT